MTGSSIYYVPRNALYHDYGEWEWHLSEGRVLHIYGVSDPEKGVKRKKKQKQGRVTFRKRRKEKATTDRSPSFDGQNTA